MSDVDSISLIEKRLILSKSELIYDFKTFNMKDWNLVFNPPKWRLEGSRLVGGSPDESTHGQIFFKEPILGDVVLEFDAEIVSPSYHDLVWWWNTRLTEKGWGDGYLGCLAGWYDNLAGIERTPSYLPCSISPSFRAEPGVTYHIVSGGIGEVQFVAVNGEMVVYMRDPKLPATTPGYFGFGVYESQAAYWNLKVWRPFTEKVPLKYVPGTQYHK